MNRILIVCVLGTAGLSNVRAALDLTPTPVEYTNEGMVFKQLVFKEGDRRVTYEPPQKWSYRGAAGRLQLVPPNNVCAEADIQAIPLATPLPALDDATVGALKQQFMTSLPPGAQYVTVVGETPEAIPLQGSHTYEISASYQTLGETFVRTAIFANFPETQLIFRFTARKTEFDKLYREFRGSILSWRQMDPQPPRGMPSAALSASPVAH